jgi:signal transduction histidine kinase
VRFRVTLLATAAVAGVLLISAVGLVSLQRGLHTHGIDEVLRQRADNLQGQMRSLPAGAVLPSEGDLEDSFLQLLDPAGEVIASTPNVRGPSPAVPAAATDPVPEIRTITGLTISRGEFRVLTRRIDTADGPRTLVVGKNLDDVTESVHILTISLAVSVPVVVSLLAFGVWWFTGRVLAPVEAIRAEVAGIGGDQLNRRVPVLGSQDEISRLAETMNAMLDRVEHATERQRVFVADASHELRGPLTRLRSELEVALAHPQALDPKELGEDLLTGVVELQRLVDDLLFLARSDSGSIGGTTAQVDLDDLVLVEAKRLRERGRVRVDTSATSAARVLGDAHQLSRAITNLASNAERHARSLVSFEVRERDGRSEVVVSDDGPGIATQHRDLVFERFTRLDHARSPDAGGAGLGLAIVHDIVARHGGTITIASTAGNGARFVMALPRAD